MRQRRTGLKLIHYKSRIPYRHVVSDDPSSITALCPSRLPYSVFPPVFPVK
ncbi:hypothetical protein NEISICOT_00315 [Neisseria sicca ATCC 29256]|uniref:Uncharacterized protein n=1 Tax=Neisseria sicca ATCC 29256 TaxID=547045 RepID=C6M1D5_NEISI|nr:hypothetical protein NEISICOT_00315 [Neisseria sicca ATCC 29256]